MEISGKLFKVLPQVEGQGKNGRWVKCDFVIETEDKYPKKVCLTAWNELVDAIKNYNEGDPIKAQFDVSSREYNGKWYTDLKAWRLDNTGSGSSGGGNRGRSNSNMDQSSNDIPSYDQSPSGGREDDLPF